MRNHNLLKNFRQVALILVMVMLVCVVAQVNAFDSSLTYVSRSEQWSKNKAQLYPNVRSAHPDYFYKGMILMGTWLIDLSVFNDAMYNLAQDSIERSGQNCYFYYSELADPNVGEWRDARSASGLNDISYRGEKIPESDMQNLWISNVVLADGRIRDVEDVANGPGVNVFINPYNTINPYDILRLPELESVYSQFQQYEKQYSEWINNKYSSPTFDYIQEQHRCITCAALRLDNWTPLTNLFPFLRQNMQNAETQQCDQDLDVLYSYYDYYSGQNNREYADQVMRLMEATDARRRAISYKWLAVEGTDSPTSQEEAKNARQAGRYKEWIRRYGSMENIIQQTRFDIFAQLQFLMDFGVPPEAFTPPPDNSSDNIPRIATTQNLIYSGITYNQRRRGRDDEGEYNDNYYDVTFSPDSAYVDALSDALEKCNESYAKYEQLALSDMPDQILQHMVYETSERAITYARQRNVPSLESNLHELVILDNIEKGAVINRGEERDKLTELMTIANSRMTDGLGAGVTPDYGTAKNQGMDNKYLNTVLDDQKGLIDNVVGQLHSFITGMVVRLEKTAAISFIDTQINYAESRRSVVKSDEFSAKAGEVIDAHIAWLRQLRNSVLGDETGDDELDKLKADIEKLEDERMDALDNNNLDEANDLADQIGELQDQVEVILAQAAEVLNSGDPVAAAAAASQLKDTPQESAEEIANKAKEDIAEGELGNVDRYLDALSGLGATKHIEEIEDMLGRNGAPKRFINMAKDAAESSKNSDLMGGGSGGSGGSGSGKDGKSGDQSGQGGAGSGAGGGAGGEGTGTGGDQSGQEGADDGTGDGTGEGTGDEGEGGEGTGDGKDKGDGTGTGTGSGTGTGKDGKGGDQSGQGSRLSDAGKNAIDKAIENTFGASLDNLNDADKAAVLAGLSEYYDKNGSGAGGSGDGSGSGSDSGSGKGSGNGAGDGSGKGMDALAYAKKLLDDLLNSGSTFIYKQYAYDTAIRYVNLAAVDLCRDFSGFRNALRDSDEAMAQTNGPQSYVFVVGDRGARAYDESRVQLDQKPVAQADSYISEKLGKESGYRYTYISQTDSEKVLSNSCRYVPDSNWAVLVTPKMNRKVKEFLDALDKAGV